MGVTWDAKTYASSHFTTYIISNTSSFHHSRMQGVVLAKCQTLG